MLVMKFVSGYTFGIYMKLSVFKVMAKNMRFHRDIFVCLLLGISAT